MELVRLVLWLLILIPYGFRFSFPLFHAQHKHILCSRCFSTRISSVSFHIGCFGCFCSVFLLLLSTVQQQQQQQNASSASVCVRVCKCIENVFTFFCTVFFFVRFRLYFLCCCFLSVVRALGSIPLLRFLLVCACATVSREITFCGRLFV